MRPFHEHLINRQQASAEGIDWGRISWTGSGSKSTVAGVTGSAPSSAPLSIPSRNVMHKPSDGESTTKRWPDQADIQRTRQVSRDASEAPRDGRRAFRSVSKITKSPSCWRVVWDHRVEEWFETEEAEEVVDDKNQESPDGGLTDVVYWLDRVFLSLNLFIKTVILIIFSQLISFNQFQLH